MAPSKANRERIAKACKAMKPFGVSAVTVKSALKRLLQLYEKNWMYIEEDNYKLLIETIFEPPGDTMKEDFNLCDESDEEDEPPLKKTQVIDSTSEKEQMVESDVEIMDDLEDHQNRGKKPIPLAVSYPDKKDVESMDVLEDHQDRGKKPISLSVVLPPVDQVQNDHVSKPTFPETICSDKDDESPPGHLSDNASLSKTLAEGKELLALEYNDLDGKENEENFPVSSEIDIASSSNGEVKLSFSICKPPPGFCVPSLDAIMKQIEDRYHEKFRGLGTEFSLSDLLNEMCESLMEQGIGTDKLTPIETPRFLADDIARGYEEQKISLVNAFNEEKQPVFTYIPKNVIYKTANVKFMTYRLSDKNCCFNCFNDCSSGEVRCACAGAGAYTGEGLIKESFLETGLNPSYFYCDDCPLERMKDRTQSGSCRGHLVRKFIKECWYKCGCGINCGNRVVQRGIKVNLQVFMTREGKGWGLRTLEDLAKGVFVCEYVGEIVTYNELVKRNEEKKNAKQHAYPVVLLDADWGSEGLLKDEEALCLDATSFGNVAHFINHRCMDANLVEIPVEVESPDHRYYHLAFFTIREVKAMEELTWDYGIDFEDESHGMKAFQCKCGSKLCRHIKRKRGSRCSQ